MAAIRFVGVRDLSPEERLLLDELAARYHPKIERALRNEVDLVVHVKTHKAPPGKEGGKKFSVPVHVNAPTKAIKSSKADSWELGTALRQAFEEVERQAQHTFKD